MPLVSCSPLKSKARSWLTGPTSVASTSLRPANIAVNLMTGGASVVQFVADVQHCFVISCLGCLISKLADRHEIRHVLFPILTIHRSRPAVLTEASWRQKQRHCIGKSNGGLINSQPSRIYGVSPLNIVKRYGHRLFRLVRGIFELKVEYDVRIIEGDGSHELGKGALRRWKGSAGRCGNANRGECY